MRASPSAAGAMASSQRSATSSAVDALYRRSATVTPLSSSGFSMPDTHKSITPQSSANVKPLGYAKTAVRLCAPHRPVILAVSFLFLILVLYIVLQDPRSLIQKSLPSRRVIPHLPHVALRLQRAKDDGGNRTNHEQHVREIGMPPRMQYDIALINPPLTISAPGPDFPSQPPSTSADSRTMSVDQFVPVEDVERWLDQREETAESSSLEKLPDRQVWKTPDAPPSAQRFAKQRLLLVTARPPGNQTRSVARIVDDNPMTWSHAPTYDDVIFASDNSAFIPHRDDVHALKSLGIVDDAMLHPTTAMFVPPKGPVRTPVLGLHEVKDNGTKVLETIIDRIKSNPSDLQASPYYLPFRLGFRRGGSHGDDDGGEVDWTEGPVVDAVVTYLRPDVPGLIDEIRRYAAEEDVDFKPSRFRDFDELRYLLRSIQRYGSQLIRRVVLVVANPSHVPAWINLTAASRGGDDVPLAVVTHNQIFPPGAALPSFSSFAIESHLHRIPGLSELFLYFNNDMMLGRRLSILDLVRPVAGGSLAHGAVDVEPLAFVEKKDVPHTCRLSSPRAVTTQAFISDVAQEARGADVVQTLLPPLECTTAPNERTDPKTRPERNEFNRFYRYSKRLVWDRLGINPTHTFAHSFRFMRRSVFQGMVEEQFPDVVSGTQANHMRHRFSFWATFVYAYYEVALRTWTIRDRTGVNKAIRECVIDLARSAPVFSSSMKQHRSRLNDDRSSPIPPMVDQCSRSVFRQGIRHLVQAAWKNVFLSPKCVIQRRVSHADEVEFRRVLQDMHEGNRALALVDNSEGLRVYSQLASAGLFPEDIPLSCEPLLLTEHLEERSDLASVSTLPRSHVADSRPMVTGAHGSRPTELVCFDLDNDLDPWWYSSAPSGRVIANTTRSIFDPPAVFSATSSLQRPLWESGDDTTDSITYERFVDQCIAQDRYPENTRLFLDQFLRLKDRHERILGNTTRIRSPWHLDLSAKGRLRGLESTQASLSRQHNSVWNRASGTWLLSATIRASFLRGLKRYANRADPRNFIEERLFSPFFYGDAKNIYWFMMATSWQAVDHVYPMLSSRNATLYVAFNDDFPEEQGLRPRPEDLKSLRRMMGYYGGERALGYEI